MMITQDEAREAVRLLREAEVKTRGIYLHADGELVINVIGPAGGTHRREYKSLSAFRKALPTLKARNERRKPRPRSWR